MAKASRNRPQVGSVEESAFVELARTADILSRAPARLLKTNGLSPTQYNVLRILRGAPAGLACGEIAGRMITRDPDVTRLLDRLEKSGLISRSREERDRRTVKTRITTEGLTLLAQLDAPMLALHRKQLGHLRREQLRGFSELLRQARGKSS